MLRISTVPLVLLAALGLLFGPAVALHGPAPLPNTGKIAGVVTDDAGDPLPGANVVIDGTAMGAATNIDGEYVILGIPVGEYDVIASFVGFTSVTVTGVQVAANLTRVLDFELPASSNLDEVVVRYEGPLQQNDAIGVPKVVTGEEAENLPVRGVGNTAAPQASVYSRERDDNLNIRGGRSEEVVYYVNGVRVEGPHDIHPGVPSDRESYASIQENAFLRVGDAPLSTFGIDVDAASYANTRRFLNSGRLPPADAVRIEEFVNYFSYDYPDPEADVPFSITTEVAVAPWQPAHRLVRIGLQGRRIDTEDLPPANLVFLLDVSGSMGNADKLPLLKSALRLLVNELREEDTVAIAVYAGAAGVVLEPTSGADKETILEALDRLNAGGSTAGGEGIRLAYQLARQQFDPEKNNRVLLATDGDFNVGASSDAEMQRLIEEERESGVFLSVLGFGQGNLQDSKMEAIANHGNGNYAYIDTIQEAQKTLVAQMGGTLFTIAKDVKLQIEFNPTAVAAYRLIGYENRLLADEDFNDDTKDSGDLGAGHSVTALYEVVPVGADSPVLASLPTVDPLRYQNPTGQQNVEPTEEEVFTPTEVADELLFVKLRYKQPDGDTSALLTHTVRPADTPMARASADTQFAAAVAGFGMLLRRSAHAGDATYEDVLALARDGRGADPNGYRGEFIRLVETAGALQNAQASR
ncbi:MAG: von Willebrand factor type A domain-containing protein [Bacteroidota bacterium]